MGKMTLTTSKINPEPFKIEAIWGQEGASTAQKSKKNIDPTKATLDAFAVAVF